MKIVAINTVPVGSTGKIMLQIIQIARKHEHEAIAFATHPFLRGYKDPKCFAEPLRRYSTFFENSIHFFLARFFGHNGCFSVFSTYRLIKKLKKISPDIVHLHNLHSSCINIKILFEYLKSCKVRVIWTLHDCWAFTGHCANYDMIQCSKWKTGCHHCSQYKAYPKSYIDDSKKMFARKTKWFTGISDLTIVTPSQWLADQVKQSFLKEYPVKVINNGIDLNVFQPTESDFRKKYHCENKYVLLGVAFGWGARKGLDVFVDLAKRLDERYQIVLVGTNEKTDKRLPENIVSIHRTQNQKELAEIYTASDLFVNPTREENFPTVNIESLACGTPIVSFRTGGSPEIFDETCGSVVEKDDIDGLLKEIDRISTEQPFTKEACLARAKNFDMHDKFEEYVKLYEKKD